MRSGWLILGISILTAGAGASEWEVIDPVTVLAGCRAGASGPIFRDARGLTWPLILETEDPEISNPGSGRFHPMPVRWVHEALEDLGPEIGERLTCRIYVLPFPRRGLLRSSCDGRAIYLSPAVRPPKREEVHFLVTHEVGHMLHRRLLPDADGEGWASYCRLRGINTRAQGRDHPHEVFAEDFRRVFGGPLSRAIEPLMASSAPPLSTRPGVTQFFEALLLRSAGLTVCAFSE